MNAPSATAALPLGRGLLFVFALPAILQAFMQAPAQSLLQGIYAKESGLALTALGAALLLVRLADMCSDLLIGYCSDRSRRHGGSRKPWIAAGMLISIVSIWFLFRPPAGISIGYYAAWFLLANIGWSLIEIPYKAWTLEFAPEPAQRTRIVTWVAFCTVLGAILFYAVGPLGKALGSLSTAEPTLQMLRLAAVVIAILLPLPILLTLWRIPDQRERPADLREPAAAERFMAIWPSVIGNGPLLRLLGCIAVTAFLGGLPVAVLLLYLTNYLGLGGEVNAVLALSIPISMLGLPVWGLLAQRYPLQRVWAAGMLLAGVAYASLGLVPPESGMTAVAIINCVVAFGLLSTLVAAPVIMGDVIDHGRETFGVERAGLYMSLQGQVVKGCGALAAGASLMLLGYSGFDAGKTGAALTPQAVFALKWLVAWLPGAGIVITALLLWFVPIGREARAAAAARQA